MDKRDELLREPTKVYLWLADSGIVKETYPMACVYRNGHSRYRYNLTRASCRRLFAWAQGERKEPVTDPGHTWVRWDGWTWRKE